MSIKIEVTGASIEEVAYKLLALGGKLRVGVNEAAAPVEAPGEPEKPKRSRSAKTTPIAEEPAPSPDVSADVSSNTSGISEASPEPADEVAPAPSDEQTPPPLDFDKDVTPAVLNAVETHGRDKVAELLGQFGVARAGQLDEARWPELLQALSDI